jgi:hypothetical protein
LFLWFWLFFLFLFFVLAILEFELRASRLLAGALPIEPFFCVGYFQDRVLKMNYFPELAWNYDPPALCLLSSWDYRYEPLIWLLKVLNYILNWS